MEHGTGGRSQRYEFVTESNSSPAPLTLGGILSIKQTPPYRRAHDRTLLELIRNDQVYGKESKMTWKMIREKFRLKLSSSTTMQNDTNTSTVNEIVNERTEFVENEQPVTEEGTRGEPRMSLMSLLEVEANVYINDDEKGVEEEEEDGGGGEGYNGNNYNNNNNDNNCCVCMVRDKGAAFIPCGHTFCRLCCRELFVKRASCPLCNHFILEILDIF